MQAKLTLTFLGEPNWTALRKAVEDEEHQIKQVPIIPQNREPAPRKPDVIVRHD
jgi:hypothetical protein